MVGRKGAVDKELSLESADGRGASPLTQEEDFRDLIAICTSWETLIHALPSIPKVRIGVGCPALI